MATTVAICSRWTQPSVDVVLYRDLLCVRSHLVATRLEALRRRLGPWFSWRIRPFPARRLSAPFGEREIEDCRRELEAVLREPDCPRIDPGFFSEPHPAGAGLTAMAAVEAAFFQSEKAGRALDAELRRAVFEQARDIGLLEVVMDLAEGLKSRGLDTRRLRRDLLRKDWEGWRDRLLDRRGAALDHGVDSPPAVRVGDRILPGVRPVSEYSEAVCDALASAVTSGCAGLA